jgi:hypothetical protein
MHVTNHVLGSMHFSHVVRASPIAVKKYSPTFHFIAPVLVFLGAGTNAAILDEIKYGARSGVDI